MRGGHALMSVARGEEKVEQFSTADNNGRIQLVPSGNKCTLNLQRKSDGLLLDSYELPVGIRTVSWNSDQFFINNSPFYFRGFGKHEDYPIRGKGLDWPYIIKDFNLLHWVGANSFRTSHYPYSEEIVQTADRYGIVIIDEVPAVALRYFHASVLDVHKQMVAELIQRDKNNPSVVMWSLGNECKTAINESQPYFRELATLTREMDPTRAVTIVTNQDFDKDVVVPDMDLVCVNRYYGWYIQAGHTELIQSGVIDEYTKWRSRFKKPIIVAEYGAGAVAGMHAGPGVAFTEEYQIEVFKEHFKAFKHLRNQGFFAGEMIWNFADFMTQQEVNRVFGNRKGIFTRDRQPKSSAFVVQSHYLQLALELDKHLKDSPSAIEQRNWCLLEP
ncbi:unnamed protein product [Notodromas monacha]|uniref:Glycoside hydrolase family 2 catalytic domain-containing protein n=1 Tax=Notodromas monacha TaxID=399045 RepID=A0A7R9GB50_9CRUS|nr:unnamed protein product [Notodromas monacha]CAG0914706.1 unnamed protein product [Notodromas monacha]